MLPYIFLLIIIFLDFAWERSLLKKNIVKELSECKTFSDKFISVFFKFRILTIIALVLFSTFRHYSVGMDVLSYKMYYDKLCHDKSLLFKDSFGFKLEFGFTFLNSVLAVLNMDFRFLLFIVALISSISFVAFFNKLSPNKLMSCILYVNLGIFAQSLNTLRQIIAMSIILFAIIKLRDKKWISSIILILCACLFHVSALCCLILVPIRYFKPKWYLFANILVLTILVGLILPGVLKLLEILTPLDYYTKYFVNIDGFIVESDLINNLYSLSLIGMFLVFWLVKNKFLRFNAKNEDLYDFCLMIFVFVPLIRIFGFIINAQTLFQRVSMYYFVILTILIPLFVKGLHYNKKVFKVANIMVYVISFGYMYYLYSIKLSCGVVPYRLGV